MPRLLFLPLILLLGACATTASRKTAGDTAAELATGSEPAVFEQSARLEGIQSDWLKPSQKPYVLGPGDKLEIEILGEEGTRAFTFVTPDSKIYYDLLPGVEVKGLSTRQLQAELETQLAKFYRQPQVAVTLKEASSQRVWVLGRVNAPGTYPINRPLRVLDAVTQAGGLFTSRFTGTTEELADLKHSFLVRGGRMMPVNFEKLIREGDLSQNIYLEANDFIYLPSALTSEVYVLGAVAKPQPVGFMNEMNLMAALGKGQGALPQADLKRVKIIRGSLTEPQMATVNAVDILNGKAANVKLEPGDIVYVPGAGTALSPGEYLRDAVNTFTRLAAANEGVRSATDNGVPIGVNVNLNGAN